MAEQQIGHRKSSLVLSARFPVVKWRPRSVAKSTYLLEIIITKNTDPLSNPGSLTLRWQVGWDSRYVSKGIQRLWYHTVSLICIASALFHVERTERN